MPTLGKCTARNNSRKRSPFLHLFDEKMLVLTISSTFFFTQKCPFSCIELIISASITFGTTKITRIFFVQNIVDMMVITRVAQPRNFWQMWRSQKLVTSHNTCLPVVKSQHVFRTHLTIYGQIIDFELALTLELGQELTGNSVQNVG